jgi:hypothetical protein
MTRRPFAPALAHIAASVPMLSFRRCVEGWLLSNTHPLQCFPEHPRCKVCCRGGPLRIGLGVFCLTVQPFADACVLVWWPA